MSIKKENEGEKEKVTKFYRVDDMFHFDNIGFSNTVGNYKVLTYPFYLSKTMSYSLCVCSLTLPKCQNMIC